MLSYHLETQPPEHLQGAKVLSALWDSGTVLVTHKKFNVPSSLHESTKMEPDLLAWTCHPRCLEAEAGGLQVQGLPWLQSEFEASLGS